jgi:hypothetical protein
MTPEVAATVTAPIYDQKKTAELRTLMEGLESNDTRKLAAGLSEMAELIRTGADPTVANSGGQTPLHFAVQAQSARSLEKVINAAKESNHLTELLSTLTTLDKEDNGSPMNNLCTGLGANNLEEIFKAIEETEQFDVLARALLQSDAGKRPVDSGSQIFKQELQAFLDRHKGVEALDGVRAAFKPPTAAAPAPRPASASRATATARATRST